MNRVIGADLCSVNGLGQSTAILRGTFGLPRLKIAFNGQP